MPGDQRPDRDETVAERFDRNWNELLQELRVVQTGVQILTGFLITLPFQQRFEDLSPWQHGVYLGALGLSTMATGLLIAPVIAHRLLFQKGRKDDLVRTGNRLAQAGVVVLGLAVAAVLYLVVGVVAGGFAGAVAAAAAAVVFLGLWFVLPLRLRDTHEPGYPRQHR